jgi:hypothetical protein
MRDLDFLPIEYHQRHARQQVQPWRIAVVVAFVALLAGGIYLQHRQKQRVRQELAMLMPCYEDAVRRANRLTELQAKLRDAQSEAELLTYLRHPWPRTQLLAAVLLPLSKEITISGLQISREAIPETTVVEQRSPADRKSQEASTAKMSSAQRDLGRLREEFDKARTILRVAGVTIEPVPLHRYLSALAKCNLFAKAQLTSIEGHEGPNGNALQFHATIVVKPGYGQPDGPVGPVGPDEKTVSQAAPCADN